jgi:RHS repeat-associated protein
VDHNSEASVLSIRKTFRQLLLTACVALIVASLANAQSDPLQAQGITPAGSYQHGDIDSVNMQNGALTLHIPLYSLPQRGRLSLSYSIIANTTVWDTTQQDQCTTTGCYIIDGGGLNYNKYAARLAIDQQLQPGMDQFRYLPNSNTFYNVYWVQDSTGAKHQLGYDNTNLALLRANDGSGLLFAPGNTTPYHPFDSWPGTSIGTIYEPSGIKHVFDSSGNPTIKDPDGNSLVFAGSQITDSLGRTFPSSPPAPTSSTAGCPTVTANYQPTISSAAWIVPGPNGTNLPFLFCYASVTLRTNFPCLGQSQSCQNATNGGLTALQSIVLPNGTYWAFTYDSANSSDTTSIGYAQVTQVRLPTGGTISYQYQTFANSCASAKTPNFSRSVVQRTLDPRNGSPTSTWTYYYSSSTYNNTITDALGNDSVFTFSALSSGIPGACDIHETKQQVYQGSQSSGKLLKTKATAYQTAASNPQSGYFSGGIIANAAVLPSTVTTTLDNGQVTTTSYQYTDDGFADVQPACTITGSQTYSCTNSPSQQIPFGRETSVTTTDYGGATLATVQTQYQYQQNSSYRAANFLSLVASTTTLDGSGTQVAKTTYGYDENNGSPQGIFGHQTSVNRWLNTTGANLTAKKVYNAQGMVTQSIDPLLNATTFTYDSTGAFLSQIQSPTTSGITHIEHFSIDSNTGLTTSHTDQNAQVTSTQYDVMRRPTQVNYPDGGQTTNCYTDTGGATCTQAPPPFKVVTTRKINSSQNETTTAIVDGLGRLTQAQLNSDPDCPSGDKTDTTYDALGRAFTVSNPYCATTDPTYGRTTYTYDALGRTTQVTHPDNTTVLTTYTGRATQVQDEGNGTQSVTRISQTDGLGRLSSLCEVASGPFVVPPGNSTASLIGSAGSPVACGQDIAGTGFLTSYQYDTLSNLLRVNQTGIAPRSFTYDSLSRLLTASNPESGAISYTYYANGNLFTKTAPAPNQTGTATVTTTYQYDALNRLLTKSYSDTATISPTFYYDAPPSWAGPRQNAIGRMTASATVSCMATLYDYDLMGRTTGRYTYRPYSCGTYPLNYTYDLAGNLTSETDGNWHTSSYTYNAAGRLTSVTNSQNAPWQPPNLLSGVHYNALGGVTSGTTAFGEIEAYGYDNRGRLQSSAITLNNATIYSFNISSFAPNSDVLAVNDSVNGNWTYSYDAFNRLVGANQNGGQAVYNYVYDRFGNRWQQNGPHAFLATFTGNSPSTPQNNNRMDGYFYDAAGNLLNDGTHSYTYDAENRIIKVDGGNTATYSYDGEGNRAVKTNSGTINSGQQTPDPAGTVEFLYDLRGRMVHTEAPNAGTGWRGEVYAGNRHLATYLGQAIINHSDWLGTERHRDYVTYDTHQLYNQNLSSLPFGDWLAPGITDDWTPINFTGQHHDFESGLDYFGARYNASSMGRWMSPDAINLTDERVQNPANTLNKYVYGGNNPLKYIDPDGRDITVFYSNGGRQGHFWLFAYDQSTGDSAVLDFGPKAGSSLTEQAAGIGVPGDTNYGSHMTSADEIRQDYTSLTIQTNPEDTQKAIEAINTYNGVDHEYMLYQQNCTTVCRDVFHKILKLDSTSIRPVSLWGDIYRKWSNAALSQRPGSKPPNVQSKHGTDYGRARYGMNTFDFAWLLLHPPPKEVVTVRILCGPADRPSPCQ